MDNRNFTNSDKMLQIVLSDTKLSEYGEYSAEEYNTIDSALNSENAVVVAVAKMISGIQRGSTPKEIYNEVSNYLKSNLI
ncbi:MAG: hypothetical protein LUH15_15110 [Tannerellaceae bacterium]|nr:hypothetical protein [Tannerellaceae bacterium]